MKEGIVHRVEAPTYFVIFTVYVGVLEWHLALLRVSGSLWWHSSKWVYRFNRAIQYISEPKLFACSIDTEFKYHDYYDLTVSFIWIFFWIISHYHKDWILMEKMMMIMIKNCFCGMVDLQKVFDFISSQDHYQTSYPSRISDTPRTGFEPAQNLSSAFVEWSCAAVIATTPRPQI